MILKFREVKSTYIIGLNAYPGAASACIIKDGEIIAIAGEQRFLRIKHCARFPAKPQT